MSLLRQGTYSIVARDPDSGELGVAVQSHWFSVGSVVTWARPGVGGVATQANARLAYGPELLERLERGQPPEPALRELLAADAAASSRQVAVVSARGEVATHTGAECMAEAGHATGAQVSCQANIMADARVWPVMLETFETTRGRLSDRLLAALDAAEAAGGDLRGRQSAALLVVPAAGEPWERIVELRVEDADDPLDELRRLLDLHDAYAAAAQADTLAGEGRHDEAAALYERAVELGPDNDELLFWAGLGAAYAGRLETGTTRVREAIERHAGWAELLQRLTPATAPAAQAVRDVLNHR